MPDSQDLPPPSALRRALEARYTPLATGAGALSCGDALDVAAPREGETVLDLGSGRGRDVLRAAERVGSPGLAIGVDSNDSMLAEARRSAIGMRRVFFVRGELAAVPLPGGRLDVVVSSCAINHAPDKAAVYREIHRLLRPGGRFVVSDVVSEAALPDEVRRDPVAWAACYGGAIREAEYLAAARAAGFAEVRVVRRTEPYERGGVRVLSITLEGRR